MHILIIGGISRSLINFRGPLIRDMLAAGHKVTACAGTPDAEVATILETWGVRFVPVPLVRAGMNPVGDIQTFLALRGIMLEHRPDIVLAYTIKPVIWGGIAARSCGIRNVFSLITGLGYAFVDQTLRTRPQTADRRLQTIWSRPQTTDRRLKTAFALKISREDAKTRRPTTKLVPQQSRNLAMPQFSTEPMVF